LDVADHSKWHIRFRYDQHRSTCKWKTEDSDLVESDMKVLRRAPVLGGSSDDASNHLDPSCPEILHRISGKRGFNVGAHELERGARKLKRTDIDFIDCVKCSWR